MAKKTMCLERKKCAALPVDALPVDALSVAEALSDREQWNLFLSYKLENGHLRRSAEDDIINFVRGGEYEPVVESILRGEPLPPPRKSMIQKLGSQKKRIVYTYPREINYVLKYITYLLLRKYDCIFNDNLYSFRVSHGAKQAIAKILASPDAESMYAYKVDISDYFNSVNVDMMLEILKKVLCAEGDFADHISGSGISDATAHNGVQSDGKRLYELFEGMLKNEYVLWEGQLLRDKKGLMAGTPTAVFLANLYLCEMDRFFETQCPDVIYARYSDDILVLARTPEQRLFCERKIDEFLDRYGLKINPDKVSRAMPGERWDFLGISYFGGAVDVSPISVKKIKDKMRRKARALLRWRKRKNTTHENAVRAFIRSFERKFLGCDDPHELTWVRWYFSLINTDAGLGEIDRYMQDCIRYIATEKRTKKRFDFRYEHMKDLGYFSLVHLWHEHKQSPHSAGDTEV